MSNRLLYDPLLVRALASELDGRLRGRACAAAPLFMSERVAALPLDRGEALQLDLHPTRGWVRLVRWEEESEELDAVCTGVESVTDERLLAVRLRAGDRFRTAERRLVVELHTNQWNALLVADEDDRILSSLRARAAGDRSLRPGAEYRPPPPAGRFVGSEQRVEVARALWREEIADAPPGERRARLLRRFAWTGVITADWLVGPTGGEVEPWVGFQRWWWVRSLPAASPVLLRTPRGVHPYPFPLRGFESEPVPSLLEGMARLAEREPEPEPPPQHAAAERLVARRIRAAERKVARLEEELAGAGGAAELRLVGDLLLAHLHAVPRGAASVTLADWEGNEVEIALDPTLSPAENANRWYTRARRKERADERLPDLLEAARAELARWSAAAASLRDGILPEGVLDDREGEPREEGGREETDSRPFRVYRTSGGLEVRVGRNARDNDRLTFGHSSPNEVWLHARSVPGSHVILRWSDPEASPPARDLEEAASLAAWFSRARTSGLVPVDWTRRKYVRKPRGAPPGAVIPQRVRTVFVEPDPSVDERLRA